MRICIVYDCLYPYTVGGAERWYQDLSLRLAEAGHDVTYLTLRQWDEGQAPSGPVRVVAVGPPMELYVEGRRRIAPPLRFGLGVLRHLLRHGRSYDVVHTDSFPYFSLLAARLARPRGRFALVVDWFEVWTRAYWSEYLGRVPGRAGWLVQKLCVRTPQHAFCFSRLHARRLQELGVKGDVSILEGLLELKAPVGRVAASEPVVVFAGRHIPEKDPGAVVGAVAVAREAISGLRAEIYGDGPERASVIARIEEAGLAGIVDAPGFVEQSRIEQALRKGLCLLLPSRREGYGLVVLEAMARGTPVIVAASPDNAAVELIVDGVNGFVAPSAAPDDLAAAVVRVHEAGIGLRESTQAWFEANAARLSLAASLDRVLATYERLAR